MEPRLHSQQRICKHPWTSILRSTVEAPEAIIITHQIRERTKNRGSGHRGAGVCAARAEVEAASHVHTPHTAVTTPARTRAESLVSSYVVGEMNWHLALGPRASDTTCQAVESVIHSTHVRISYLSSPLGHWSKCFDLKHGLQ